MMIYYQITLWVTLEQENAIQDLFRQRRWSYSKIDGCCTSYDNQNANLLQQELIPPSFRGSFGLEVHNSSIIDPAFRGILDGSFAPTYNTNDSPSITQSSYSEYQSSSITEQSYNEPQRSSLSEPSYSENHNISITETACGENHNTSVTGPVSETHNVVVPEPAFNKDSCDSSVEPPYSSNQYTSNSTKPYSSNEHNRSSAIESSYDERYTNRNTEHIYRTNHNSDITAPTCCEHQDSSITEPSYCKQYGNCGTEPYDSENRNTSAIEPSNSEHHYKSVTEPPHSDNQSGVTQGTCSEIKTGKSINNKKNIDNADQDPTGFCNHAIDSQMTFEKDAGGGAAYELNANQPVEEYGPTSYNHVQEDQTSGSETEDLGDKSQVHMSDNVMEIATCDNSNATATPGTAISDMDDLNINSRTITKHRSTKQTKYTPAGGKKNSGTENVRNKKKAKKGVNPVRNTVGRQQLHCVRSKKKMKDTVQTSPAGDNPNHQQLNKSRPEVSKDLLDNKIAESVVETQKVFVEKTPQGGKSKSGSTVKEIYCKHCEHLFLRRRNYDRHLQTDKCKHVCEFCGKVFLYGLTANYKMHLKYHNKQKDFECKICGELFIERGKMLQHYDRHTIAKPVMCDQCGDTFARTSALSSHKTNMHNENKPKFPCSKCTRVLDSKSGLRYHMKHNHNTGNNLSFPCFICGKLFKERSLLKVHEVGHKETRDFKCDQCSATFKRTSGLATHKKRHAKDHRHFCRVCKKGFFSPMELHSHERTHTGERPYKCSLCDYRCAHRSNMYKHEKVHRKTL